MSHDVVTITDKIGQTLSSLTEEKAEVYKLFEEKEKM